jgi:outer membrane protein assembly factor BamB
LKNVRQILAIAVVLTAPLQAGTSWPEFRGPTADGHSDAKGVPLKWGESENVKWKTPIPGRGWSSPIIFGDQVWMTTAKEKGKKLHAICVDRNAGKLLHDVLVFSPKEAEKVHKLNSHASPSPVIEDGRVYVHFGSNGTACLETKTGKVIWKVKPFQIDQMTGAGSTPILYKGQVIYHLDGVEGRFVVSHDAKTGKIRWKTDRTNQPKGGKNRRRAFSTPTIIAHGGGDQMISVAADAVFGYDPSTGRELWSFSYSGYSTVPRPIYKDGMIVMSTGFDRATLLAVRLGQNKPTVAWKYGKAMPQRTSPLLVDGRVYLISEAGILTSLDFKSGKKIFQERIGGTYSASPVYVDGRIYLFGQEGGTFVFAPGDEVKVLAENKLEGGFMASPAIVGKAFYLRTKTHLYRIEK